MISFKEFNDMVPVSLGIPEGLCAKRIAGKRIVSSIIIVFIACNLITIYKF